MNAISEFPTLMAGMKMMTTGIENKIPGALIIKSSYYEGLALELLRLL